MSRFGIQLHANWPVREYARIARLVEQYDFEEITVHDVLWNRPVWPILTVIALNTERAKVGPDVTHPYVRHPAVTASNIAAIDEITGGRAILGVGMGSFFEPINVPFDRPLTAVRDMVEIVRKLLRSDPTPYQGKMFQANEQALLHWHPVRPDVPIFAGAYGPKMLRMCGGLVDEVRPPGVWDPRYVEMVRQTVDEGAVAAGRKPGSVIVNAEVWTSVSRDREAAIALARSVLINFIPYLSPISAYLGLDREELDAVCRLVQAGRREDAARTLSDRTLHTFFAAGTPDDIVRGSERIFDAGVELLGFSGVLGPDVEEAIHLLGKEVVPHFSR